MSPPFRAPPGSRWICVPYFRHWRSGKLIVAANYGKEAFCFLVRDKKR